MNLMEESINLAVIDDQLVFRQGLVTLLNKFAPLSIKLEAASTDLLIKRRSLKIDVVLLNYEMITDWKKTSALIFKSHPQIKILIITRKEEKEIVMEVPHSSNHGYLLKHSCIETIYEAITNICPIKCTIEPKPKQHEVNPSQSAPEATLLTKSTLSVREIEIIQLICKEYTNREIADKLFISVRTVDAHRENILRKTNSKNAIGIVMYALKNGLISNIKA